MVRESAWLVDYIFHIVSPNIAPLHTFSTCRQRN